MTESSQGWDTEEQNIWAKEARLLHKTTTVAATTDVFSDALKQFLDIICDFIGWPVGHIYLPSPSEKSLLESTSIWHLDEPEKFHFFKQITEQTEFVSGQGLPGRVLASGKPVWITDVQLDMNFPRNKVAKDIAVRGAFGFPITAGKDIVAVLEFFSDRVEEADSNILRVMDLVGSQIGRVLERQSTKMASIKQAEKIHTMNEVARSIAHDIRNPLQAIRLATDLLKDANKNEFQELLALIDRDVESADTIVKNLMDFSSLPTPNLNATNMNHVIDQVLDQLILPPKVKITTLFSDLPQLIIDPDQFSRVMINLILNAVQAMTSGGDLEIATNKVKDAITITIKDTGTGISKGDMAKIFDPFYTTKAKGTGLGLSSVTTIVEKHGGTFTIESKVGAGTTATIRLPIKK